MLILSVVILLLTLCLFFLGFLSSLAFLLLLLVSGSSIVWHLCKRLLYSRHIARLKQCLDARWVGEFTSVATFNTIAAEPVLLYISQAGQLIIRQGDNQYQLNVAQIKQITWIKGNILRLIDNQTLLKILQVKTNQPILDPLRNALKGDPLLRYSYFLFLELKEEPLSVATMSSLGNPCIMVHLGEKHALSIFYKDPTIREKVRLIDKRLVHLVNKG